MRVRILVAGVVVVLVAGVAVVTGLSWLKPSPPMAATLSAAATAEVTRGPLHDTKTVTGTLSYGELSALRPSLAGSTAMITWIAPVGATVVRGRPLYALDGQPTILFYGSAPQHRILRFDRAVAAPVWVELEQASTAATTAELTLQRERGRLQDAQARAADATARLTDALSSVPAIAEFIQLSGAVHAAEAKLGRVRKLAAAELTPTADVATAEAELATARATFESAVRSLRKDLTGASLDTAAARVAVAEAESNLDELRAARDALAARASDDTDVRQIAANLKALGYTGSLPDQVRAWQRDAGLPVTGVVGPADLIVASGPVHIADHKAAVGERLVAASPDLGTIFDYSGIDKRVIVPLSVGDQGLAGLGRTVTVTLPDNTTVEGSISEVGSVVSAGNIDVTVSIADQTALGALEVASVDVEFVSRGRDDVLSVPVGALIAMPDSGFAVEVVSGGQSTIVPVRTGLFAAGRVEISGDGIAAGMRVGVPR